MASQWRTVGWSVGQIAIQIYRDVPSLLLLFYMTQVLGIEPALAGTAIFGPKLVVAVLADLGAGWLSDRLRRRQWRAHLLLLGAVLAPVFLVLLFQAPEAESVAAKTFYVATVLTAYMIVFSLFSVPHLALGTEISDNPHTRTSAMAWRTAMSGVGLLIAASLAPVLVERFGGGAGGYASMSLLLAALCSATLAASWLGSRAIDRTTGADEAGALSPAAGSTIGGWRSVLANRAAVGLMSAFFCQLCAMGMAYATLAYLFSFNLAFDKPLEMIGIVVLLTSVMAIGIQPVWVAVARRIGRRRVYMIGLAGYVAALLMLAYAPPRGSSWVYLAGLVMGMFQSACFTTAYSMLADVIEGDKLAMGQARAGLFSALFSIIDKTGFALGGTLLVGVILQASGFVAGSATQTSDALLGITLCFAIVPAVLNVISFALMLLVYPAERRSPQPAS